MVFVTRVLKKTVGEDNEKTEMFMTANRSVRTGLTASAVVSVSFLPIPRDELCRLQFLPSPGYGVLQCLGPLS